MRLDYNEKKGGRESVERKPVQKNRPRKEPVGMFALLSVFVLVLTFGAGVATGWFFFKGPDTPPVAAVAQPAKKQEAAPPAGQAVQAAPDAPLTFYQTLPAGGKGVIGSGLNLTPHAPSAARPAPVAASAPARPQADKQETPEKQENPEKQTQQERPEKQAPQEKPEKQAQEKPDASVRYLVQIASYRDKKEADVAQAKLSGKGVAAYVVESRQAEKGVWYRLRVGRHLSKAEAEQLAGKTGKGAAVIAE